MAITPMAVFTATGYDLTNAIYVDGSTLKVSLPSRTGTGLTPGLLWAAADGTLYRIAS